jgi:hypothetical protein
MHRAQHTHILYNGKQQPDFIPDIQTKLHNHHGYGVGWTHPKTNPFTRLVYSYFNVLEVIGE